MTYRPEHDAKPLSNKSKAKEGNEYVYQDKRNEHS